MILNGDQFLLCSDGLTDMLAYSSIAEIMNSSKQADVGSTSS